MKIISTPLAPAAIGPYSQGMILGNIIFTSGQIAIVPETGALAGDDIQSQADRACKNVEAVLNAGGAKLENVVKTTCFLSDMADFAAFNAVYERYFTSKPARSCVAVKTLPKGARCEIEAIAEIAD